MESWSLLGEPPRTLKETMMEAEYNHLNHATWECKYPRRFHAEVPQEAAVREDQAALGPSISRSGTTEGVPDRGGPLVHMLIPIPPKYSVAQIIGHMKGRVRYGSRRMSNARWENSWATNSGLADILSDRRPG